MTTNITIDDLLGNSEAGLNIVYQPAGAWSTGQNCSTCEARLDPAQVHDGTWRDVSYLSDNPPSTPLTASLTFNGSAIYVYCIITRASTDPFGNTDMSFFLNGSQVDTFTQAPNGDATYHYNMPVYTNASLPLGEHTFVLQNGRAGGLTALALLDYIVISRTTSTTDGMPSAAPSNNPTPSNDPAPSHNPALSANPVHQSHTAIIAAAVAASLVAVVLAICVYCLLRRRRLRGQAVPSEKRLTLASDDTRSPLSSSPPSLLFGTRSPAHERIAEPYTLMERTTATTSQEKRPSPLPLASPSQNQTSSTLTNPHSLHSAETNAIASPSRESTVGTPPTSRTPYTATSSVLTSTTDPSNNAYHPTLPLAESTSHLASSRSMSPSHVSAEPLPRGGPWTTASSILDRRSRDVASPPPPYS